MIGRLLTAAEVADRVGVAPATVHDWVQRGQIAAVRIGGSKGGRLRIPEAELEAKLQAWSTSTVDHALHDVV